jgi:hypothetical protein
LFIPSRWRSRRFAYAPPPSPSTDLINSDWAPTAPQEYYRNNPYQQ